MSELEAIIYIVIAIFSIILFVKVWIMTNHVRMIKDKYLKVDAIEIPKEIIDFKNGFKKGDKVIELKTEKQMSIIDFKEDANMFECLPAGGLKTVFLKAGEIKLFSEYVATLR